MKVAILMGSDSDLPIMKDSIEILESFGIPYEIAIISAHRTPEKVLEYVKSIEEKGIEIIIAGAGGAAHLPGVLAALTIVPIIGVPIKTKFIDGIDSLLSIIQMPSDIPVATVGINNAKNAALLAAHILSIKYPEIKEKLKIYREKIKKIIIEKNEKLQKLGYKKYLETT